MEDEGLGLHGCFAGALCHSFSRAHLSHMAVPDLLHKQGPGWPKSTFINFISQEQP